MTTFRLHPAQAGFRANYSTLTLAAVVHIALDQRLCRGVIFLDFKAAFDIVDYNVLRERLRTRGNAEGLLEVLDSLSSANESRVLANRGASN